MKFNFNRLKNTVAGIFITILAILLVRFIVLSFDRNEYTVEVDSSEYQELKEFKNKYEKLAELEKIIKDEYYTELSDVDFESAIYKGLFNALDDPYSEYMTEEDYKEFSEGISGEFSGIGVVINTDRSQSDNYLKIVSILDDTPALEAGVKPGDLIYKIEGEDARSLSADKLLSMIRGKEGTSVNITFLRDGKEVTFDITRRKITSPSVEYQKMGNSGYIKIVEFRENTAKEFRDALSDLKSQGMKSLIIDLRNNPGGLLTVVNDIADQILDSGIIEIIGTRGINTDTTEATKSEYLDKNIPIALLVNRNSASSSEILTGALQDNERATVIGETTFGKGIVQTIHPLGDGTYYKLTSAYYLTPSGKDIHKKGIKPDIDYEWMKKKGFDPEDTSRDAILEFAVDYLK